MDANEHLVSPRRWWTDDELNQYLDTWTQDLARHFGMLSTRSSVVVGSATATITKPVGLLSINYVTWDNKRLMPTTRLLMDEQHPNWENELAITSAVPTQIVQLDNDTCRFYPLPGITGTVLISGPRDLTMPSDITVCVLPPWMQFSSRLFVAAMAYMRAGPNQDLRKAGRYKARYIRTKKFFRQMIDARFASYGPRLKPGVAYESAIMKGEGR
jgi:hypothetical protein